MAVGDERPPRLTVELEEDLQKRLHKEVRFGLLKPLINNLLKDFLKLCENHDSNIIIGAILSDELTLKDIIRKENG